MGTNLNKYGFNLIEFFLSGLALFLLLIISYPIFQDLTKETQTNQIKENLHLIRNFAYQYFQENASDSVSLYELIGPRKMISELKIIADEEYPEIILRGEKISAFSKKYGTITVQ